MPYPAVLRIKSITSKGNQSAINGERGNWGGGHLLSYQSKALPRFMEKGVCVSAVWLFHCKDPTSLSGNKEKKAFYRVHGISQSFNRSIVQSHSRLSGSGMSLSNTVLHAWCTANRTRISIYLMPCRNRGELFHARSMDCFRN